MSKDMGKNPDFDDKPTVIIRDDRKTRIAGSSEPAEAVKVATPHQGDSAGPLVEPGASAIPAGETAGKGAEQSVPPAIPAAPVPPALPRTTLVGTGPIQDFGGFGAEPEDAVLPGRGAPHAAPPHATPPAPFGEAASARRRPVEPNATRLVWDTPDTTAAPASAPDRETRQNPEESQGTGRMAEPTRIAAGAGASARPDSPVVGWFVVTKGPGRGRSREIGFGISHIGRSADARIALDFGDGGISRERNATLTYDNRGRRFFLEKGEGLNPPYVNDEIVISPVELKAGDIIQISETSLRFVPLCGPDFDWQDRPESRDQADKSA